MDVNLLGIWVHLPKSKSTNLKNKVGNKKYYVSFTGVDSSVVATLLAETIGDQLIPVFVDNGLLRANEKRTS